MDLVHQVAANLEIEAGKAEKGIGAILMALRMNLDGETFKKVKHVLPNSESLMGRALMGGARTGEMAALIGDRKSTRLNSSHTVISYAVFCLKKKMIDTLHVSALVDQAVTHAAV